MQVEELEEAGESSKLKDQHATVQKRKRGTREEEEVRPYIHISVRNRPRVFALGENGKESVRVCMCERMWLSPHPPLSPSRRWLLDVSSLSPHPSTPP